MAGGSNNFYQIGGGPQCNDYWNGAGNTNSDCRPNFTDKDGTGNERDLIDDLIGEAICLYGQKIDYYINTYNLSGADNIYGEHTTTQYWPPVETVAYVQLQEDAITLSRFGFESDDEITLYFHISTFRNTFQSLSVWDLVSHRVEPKADDVFSLKQYGSDRPFPRGAKFFIVTEVLDQDITEINALGGHYTWKVKAKRYEYSFEPGLSGEQGSDQVYDSARFGRLSAFSATEPTTGLPTNPGSDGRKYPDDADTDVVNNTYDPNNVDNDVYGGY